MNPHVINIRNAGDTPYIYIGRAMPRYGLKASIYGNPFKAVGEHDKMNREWAVESYRNWLADLIIFQTDKRDAILASIPDLAKQMLEGKKLACWCAPKSCHGDVLVELVERHLGHPLPVEEQS